MQHPGNGLFAAPEASPSANPGAGAGLVSANGTVSGGGVTQPVLRPVLPDRTVTSSTIEDTYVSFILCCNPAVSSSTDTAALREAFRTPPRSGGKSFSIYTLFQLICQLEDREIKTWAELALKLGVEPPDQDKGQSSQKIQQYAVRLKRWMHSMHVDAFFDYLMDRPHPYWTQIPSGPYPLIDHLRDGVAAKDDMALRALIPEIKPRRGRRRPDDEADQDLFSGGSPSQRARLDDLVEDMSAHPSSAAGRWSAHPDATSAFVFPPPHSQQPSQQHLPPPDAGVNGQGSLRTPPPSTPWAGGPDFMNTPLSAYPRSAITPSTRQNFWADEPKSAITPTSGHPSRRPGRRHGAKVVSSAWRSSGGGGSGKTRGRPPINRNGNHHHLSSAQDGAFAPSSSIDRTAPAFPPTSSYPSQMEPTSMAPLSTMTLPELSTIHALSTIGTSSILPPPIPQLTLSGSTSPSSAGPSRGGRPGRLSLQVPERKGAEVRLASPPLRSVPGVVLNGGLTLDIHSQGMSSTSGSNATPLYVNGYSASSLGIPLPIGFAPEGQSHYNQAPSLSDSHSPAAATNGTTGTTSATSITPEATASSINNINISNGATKSGDGSNTIREDAGSARGYMSRFGSGSLNDRTNIDELEAYFMNELFSATWYDENDQKISPCSVEEATALVEVVINDLIKAAASKEALLINLAALAGGKFLMADTDRRVKRVERTTEHTKYDCNWELRFGDVRGQFSVQEVVPHSSWKKMTTEVKAAIARAVGLDSEIGDGNRQVHSTAGSASGAFGMTDGATTFHMYNGAANSSNRYEGPPPGTVPNTSPGLHAGISAGFAPSINFGLPPGAPPTTNGGDGTTPGSSTSNLNDDNAALAAHWEKKYRNLLQLLHKRDQQLDRTRAAVMKGLQSTYRIDDTLDV